MFERISRGDLYRYEKRYTDPITKKVSYEAVPCVIVSRNERNKKNQSIVIASVSSTVEAVVNEHEQMLISEGPLKNHVINAGVLYTINANKLNQCLGALNEEDLLALDECLLNALGIEVEVLEDEIDQPVAKEPNVPGVNDLQLMMERDFYKRQYEDLLNRLINK